MTTTARKTTARKTAAAVPARAKKPQDHRPPATEQPPEVLRATVAGHEWEVPAAAIDDFELLDDLNSLDQHGDPTRMPSVLRRLLGDEQWHKAMDVLRDPTTGRVSVEAGGDFVMELIQALNPSS